MQNVEATIISQYASSPVITGLIANMNEYLDPAADFDAFYDQVWNVLTAVGYGLDVWGRIVGVSRVLQVPGAGKYVGFEEAGGVSIEGFNAAPWYAGEALTGNFSLSDPAYLVLILAKALANICNGSIPAINQILLNLFPGRGDCYVTDGEDMTMTYTFAFSLTAVEAAIVEQSGVLPRPAGVAASVVVL